MPTYSISIRLQRTVVENLTAPALGNVSRRGWLRRGIERRMSERIAATFTIDRLILRSAARRTEKVVEVIDDQPAAVELESEPDAESLVPENIGHAR